MTELVFVGRPSREKGLQDLIWALVHCTERDWFLHVVGDRLPVVLELDGVASRITFHGPMPNFRVADLMRHADVVIVPSHYETFGNVALEGMACGCLVIAARTGGLTDIVTHGVTGLHFPPGDRAALSALLDKVIAHKGELRPIRRAAAAAARACSWPIISSQTAELFHRVIGCGC